MIRRLVLEVGDLSVAQRIFYIFEIENDNVRFGFFTPLMATLPISEYRKMVKQTIGRNIDIWRRFAEPPLGLSTVQDVLKYINTTPKYHLFIGAIDFVELFGLLDDTDQRCVTKAEVLDGNHRPDRNPHAYLTLLPDKVIAGMDLNPMIDTARVCVMKLEIANQEVIRYYVPYATPIDMSEMPQAAQADWGKIRQYRSQH